MSEAREYLATMRLRVVFFYAQGGRLLWHSAAQLAGADLAQASALKPELIALVSDETLEAQCAGADPEEAEHLRQERAGILEFEGGLCRLEAELRAGLNQAPAKAA